MAFVHIYWPSYLIVCLKKWDYAHLVQHWTPRDGSIHPMYSINTCCMKWIGVTHRYYLYYFVFCI
jgi:hypothetical protein